jgi:hypothetical protein
MEKLSKEELLRILASSEKPKKARKQANLDDEKKIIMLERLASMRETVKNNREAKKALVQTDAQIKEKAIDEVFEKKYGSKFDKMTELLTELNTNTIEVVKLKKEKAAKKAEVKLVEEKKPVVEEVKAPTAVIARIPELPIRPSFPIPNRPHFMKPNTRF